MKEKVTTEMISDVLRALPNEWTSVREQSLSDILLVRGNIDKNSMSGVVNVLTNEGHLETSGSRGGLRYRRHPESIHHSTGESIEILTLKVNEIIDKPKKTIKPAQVAVKIKSDRPVYIDDEVYYMYNNKITVGTVISIYKKDGVIMYTATSKDNSAEFTASGLRNVFRSLDEMLRVMKELFLASKRKKTN